MRVLIASDVASVRDAFSGTEAMVTGLGVECLPDAAALAHAVSGDSDGVAAVFIHLKNDKDCASQETFDLARRLNGTPVGFILPRNAAHVLIRRCHASGAHATLAEDLTPELVRDMLSLMLRGVRFATIDQGTYDEARKIRARLSDRELQVLEGICAGLQNKEIAHGFDIKEVTVKMHVRAIIRKMGAKNRTHAAMIARDSGLVC